MPMKKGMKKTAPRRQYRRKGAKARIARAVKNVNANTFKTTCRWNADVGVTSGVTVSNYVYFDASALQGYARIGLTREYAIYSKLFDQFRVTGVTMRVVPRSNTQDLIIASTTPVTENGSYVFSAFDVDSVIPSNLNAIQTMRSARKHSILKPFTRVFRYKYGDSSWLDTATDYSSGTPLSNWLAKGLYAHFGFYSENLNLRTDQPWATVEIQWHIVFRGQRLVNVSQDESGQIVLGNPEAEMKPLTEVSVLSGLKDIADSNELDDVPPAS